jgi:choline dehydrogenase-like flavoprotein
MTDAYDFLVVGSGEAGKYLASSMAKDARSYPIDERGAQV